MQYQATSPEGYIAQLPDARKVAVTRLRQSVLENLPHGFVEEMNYGMIGYVVPHTKYPAGYHCDTKMPLPFMNIASQKNHIALYHMGIYTKPDLMDWWQNEYSRHVKTKLDMGKSCIRFKKPETIPFALIGDLVQKMSCDEWIELYERYVKR
jgi:uncharacterized protein YdhG (YjbR/CyaY superfamily)